MDALAELADLAYQERVWSGRDPHAMSSLVECEEALFDDSGLARALERGGAFGRSIDAKLRQLGALLDEVDATQPVSSLLCDGVLAECRALAADVLRDLASDDETPATT